MEPGRQAGQGRGPYSATQVCTAGGGGPACTWKPAAAPPGHAGQARAAVRGAAQRLYSLPLGPDDALQAVRGHSKGADALSLVQCVCIHGIQLACAGGRVRREWVQGNRVKGRDERRLRAGPLLRQQAQAWQDKEKAGMHVSQREQPIGLARWDIQGAVHAWVTAAQVGPGEHTFRQAGQATGGPPAYQHRCRRRPAVTAAG